jgi:hypothetical protein
MQVAPLGRSVKRRDPRVALRPVGTRTGVAPLVLIAGTERGYGCDEELKQ